MASASIPLFPLNTILFPGGFLPLRIFEVRYLDMVNRCIANGTGFGVVLLTQGSEVRKPEAEERLAEVGTMALIREWKAPAPGLLQILCIGSTRFRIASSRQEKHGLWTAEVVDIDDDRAVPVPDELRDAAETLGGLLASLERRGVPKDEVPVFPPYRLDDCGWVANRWCELLALPDEQKQSLLALDNPLLRLELVRDLLDEQGLLT